MPRIVGVDIPKEKKIYVSLAYIYGIGRPMALKICKTAGISPDVRAKNLTEEEVSRLAGIIQKDHRVEGNLRRELQMNIKRLMDIGSYRGSRHKKACPFAASVPAPIQGHAKVRRRPSAPSGKKKRQPSRHPPRPQKQNKRGKVSSG